MSNFQDWQFQQEQNTIDQVGRLDTPIQNSIRLTENNRDRRIQKMINQEYHSDEHELEYYDWTDRNGCEWRCVGFKDKEAGVMRIVDKLLIRNI